MRWGHGCSYVPLHLISCSTHKRHSVDLLPDCIQCQIYFLNMQISQHWTDLDSSTVSDIIILLKLIFHKNSRHLKKQERLETIRLMYKYLQFRCNLGSSNNSNTFTCYRRKTFSSFLQYQDAKLWDDLENIILSSVSKQRKLQFQKWRLIVY